MDVSIVTGTYNRLAFLKRMVESARVALGPAYGLTHEFVLVDGGSTDGTQGWCAHQPDIHLIQHPALLGAVKAFNDGAHAATGAYVLLGNDDVEFLGDGIWRAYLFMQQHPDCGIGCFYQDRHGRPWHVDSMPVVIDGHQASAYYGQVCLVPRWLGDMVNWWGDYLHTYGGDNELSSRVYELGYHIYPVPEARIHDFTPRDYLRTLNERGGPRPETGGHPDSDKWGRRWRGRPEHLAFAGGRAMVGAVVKPDPVIPNPIKTRERILYLPIYEQGWQVQKQQKRGLREALAEWGVIVEVDYVDLARQGKERLLNSLRATLDLLRPTLVLTQLHNADTLTVADLAELRARCPSYWVNWNGDFWPANLTSPAGLELARTVDLQLCINRSVLAEYARQGIKAAYWQIGWEPDGRNQPPADQPHAVVFLASGYSKARQSLVDEIRSWGLDFALYGSGWPNGWAAGQCLYDFKAGCSIYRAAKFALGDSQWPSTGFVSNRLFQALAAGGAALTHEWFADMEQLGLQDGVNCIVWKNRAELRAKLAHYLAREDDRAAIAAAGEALAVTRHSFAARVSELFTLIQRPAGRPPNREDEWRW